MRPYSLFALIILLTVGCKGKGSGGVTSSSVITSVSNGVYETCEDITGFGDSEKNQVFITSGAIVEEYTYYSGLGCSAANAIFNERFVYSYTKSGTTYFMTVEAATATAESASEVSNNNVSSYCGYSDWVQNVPKNILGRTCAGITINGGEQLSITMTQSGSTLSVSANGVNYTYTSVNAMTFASAGQALSDGNYISYDGSIALHLSLAGGNYTATYYDPNTLRYYSENGTYASSNNSSTFTVGAYSNGCGAGDEGQSTVMAFTNTAYSLALRESGVGDLLLEKVSFNSSTFASAFLTGTYTAGCF